MRFTNTRVAWACMFFLVCVLLSACSKQSRLARHLEKANSYYAARDYDKAEIQYLSVLNLDPRHALSSWRLGQIYYDEGKVNRAFVYLSHSKEAQPDFPEGRLTLGFCYISGGMPKEARAEAQFVLSKQPTNEEALILLADTATSPKETQDIRKELQSLRPQVADKAGYHVALATLASREKNLAAAEAELKQALALDPKCRSVYSGLGSLYLEQNDLAKAEQAYKSAAELSPMGSNWRLRYAEFKIQTGDADTAKRLLEQMTKEAPYYLPAWNRRAELALGEKNYEDCANLIGKVLARDSANLDALMIKGRLHLALHDAAKALAGFEQVDKLYPGDPKVHHLWAVAFLINNEPLKAENHLSQSIALDPNYIDAALLLAELKIKKGDLAPALTLLGQLLQSRPKVGQAYVLLAQAHMTQNRFDEALVDYQRLAEIFPKNPECQLRIGLVYLAQGKTAEARKSFTQALSLSPNYLPAVEQLINLDLAAKQYAAAFQQLQPQLDKTPKLPELQLLAARIYYAQTNYAQVEAALLKAIEFDPSSRDAYGLLAKFYVETQKHQQALDRLQSLLNRNPKDEAVLMQMGMIYNELKNYTAARDTYLKLLAINPQFSAAMNNLAYLYSEQFRDLDKAFQMASRARRFLPNDPYTADTLGWILFKRGDFAGALRLLEESAGKFREQPEVSFHLGMSRYMLGQEDSARTALQAAVQSRNDFSGKAEAKRRLDLLNVDVSSASPQLLSELEKRMSDEPADPVIPARLGVLYEKAGNTDKAAKTYERTLKLTPQNATVMARLASLYADQLHQTKKAFTMAQAAHQLSPDDPAISLVAGRLACQTGDFNWAASLLKQSASQFPHSPEPRYWLAVSYLGLGRVQEAQTEMSTLLQIDFPQKQDVNKFVSFLNMADHPETASLAQLEAALKSEPDNLPALWALARIQEKSNPTQAVPIYERILARYPSFFPANRQLAFLFYQQPGQIEKAYQHAVKAQRALAQDALLGKLVGILAYQRNDFAGSIVVLKDLCRTQTNDPDLFYYLGMAHYRVKAKSESTQALRQALALKVNDTLAAEAKRVLAELQ